MSSLLKILPVPLSGLMVGLVALAKLFYVMDIAWVAQVFMIIGLVCFVLLVLKSVFQFADVRTQLQNPVIASVAPTFTMGTMLIANIFELHEAPALLVSSLWVGAVILHIVLMGYFIYTFMVKMTVTMQSVFPSWFVTFVGIGMMAVTAPIFAKPYTAIVVYIATALFIVLLPFVLKRVLILRDMPTPTKPLITILAAPVSLCLLAYMTQFKQLNEALVLTGLVIAQFIYFMVLYELQILIKMPFYPSFGAFTFPLVVSTTTLYTANQKLVLPDWVEPLYYFEMIIATGVVCYVVFMYVKFLIEQVMKQLQASY